jgi:hypothetical protein
MLITSALDANDPVAVCLANMIILLLDLGLGSNLLLARCATSDADQSPHHARHA